AAHGNRVDDAAHGLWSPLVEHAPLCAGGRRRPRACPTSCGAIGERLDVDVLLVHAHDRQSERDAIVMPDGDARTAWLTRANDVPTRTDKMRDVANRGVRDGAVRIIREDRLAARGFLSAHHPIVRSLDAIERHVAVDLARGAEDRRLHPGEIESWCRIERA